MLIKIKYLMPNQFFYDAFRLILIESDAVIANDGTKKIVGFLYIFEYGRRHVLKPVSIPRTYIKRDHSPRYVEK